MNEPLFSRSWGMMPFSFLYRTDVQMSIGPKPQCVVTVRRDGRISTGAAEAARGQVFPNLPP